MNKKKNGFTIVELLILIVVIAVLAAITVVAYNGIQSRAKASKRESDMTLYYKAILAARINTGLLLRDITGSQWSVGPCSTGAGGNTANIEPKNLPKTDSCWLRYYDNLDKIGLAAQMNLSQLRAGDSNGNPYGLDENEGETCSNDVIFYFNGTGDASRTQGRLIPRTVDC